MTTDRETRLEELRTELMEALPPEQRALVQYIDTRFEAHEEKMDELLMAFRTGKAAVSIFKFMVGIGAGLAAIWAGFHANITVR